jgi:large subunit ribosomal protein L28
MARKCIITGKGVQSGNNVSHANNRTRRRYLPNLQHATMLSESLGESVRLRLSTNGIRTIEHRGGLDAYLTSTAPTKLPADLRQLRKRVLEAKAGGESQLASA